LIGPVALLAGAALLTLGALRLSARLAPPGTALLLVGAYVIAWQLVLVVWILSAFGRVERWPLLAGLALTTAAAVEVDTRGRRELGPRLREAFAGARAGFAEPIAIVLGLVVAGGCCMP
jgi:hypothetical protein